jgi:hypothetical protein
VRNFWQKLFDWLKSQALGYLRKAGILVVAITVVGYWISLYDKMANQREAAWGTLRAAISWIESDSNRIGNVGQIYAIQTLVRDCGWPWHKTFVEPVFDLLFPDYVELKSVQLGRMELGGLKAVEG